jgi:hypothetical protein
VRIVVFAIGGFERRAKEGGAGGDVTVRVVSAFQLSELVPTALVW